MFSESSNATFNTGLLVAGTIQVMDDSGVHPSMRRLYDAAKELRGVTGQSAVARLLDQLPQTVKNWEKRGVSLRAALHAQKVIRCRASWILDGEGPMPLSALDVQLAPMAGHGSGRTSATTVLQAVETIGLAMELVDQIARDQAAPLLLALTKEPARAREFGARLEATLKSGNGGPVESGNRSGTHG